MSFPYKNPISPIQILGSESVSREKSFGTNYSTLSIGGYMEVYSLDQLQYTVPSSTYGAINYSGNSIPVMFSKGSGTTFSIDTLTLNPDNISSGRKKLGMLVYVKDQDQVYQFNINNYETLWNAATGATGTGGSTVIISDFGTTVKANSPEGIAFISGWTANTIDGVGGVSQTNAVWKKYYGSNLQLTGGTFNFGTLTLTNITGGTINIPGFATGGSSTNITGGTIDYNTGTLSLIASGGTVTITGFTDYNVTGGTYSNGTATFTNNYGGSFNVTGFSTSSGVSGDYLPLSGGTVTGGTVFTSGLTANTLNVNGLTQTSGITSTGGITFKQVTINSTYSATTQDYIIDVTGGTFTVYLPSAVGIQGRLLVVKNNGGGAVTVQPTSGQNIDDKPFVILGETNTIQLVSNGSNWIVISYNISTVNSSTGVFSFTGMTIASPTTFTVAPVKGWIVDDTTNPLSPQLYYIDYSGGTHTATYVTTATETWVYLTSGGTISQTNIELTEQQRRENIFLGKLGHANKTNIINAFSQPDFVLSPLSQLRDMFAPIGLINQGIYASANGSNLRFNTSAGYLHGLGINFAIDTLSPNEIYVAGTSPCTFQYRTQTGGTASNTTFIDPTKWDVGGVVTSITGTKATNQRIYLVQNGIFRVQYGQTEYNQLTAAIEGIATEQFNTFSNFTNNGILIGILSVLSTATDLSDTSKARFFFTSKFGETVGAAGGISTTTLQQAYNNSVTPEITTNSTLGPLSVKNGAGTLDNVTNVFEGVNAAGTTTSFVRADGGISGSSISAVTYYNLPTDIRVTGATYSNNTFTYTNNTGGTFSVLFNTVTGLTTNGNLTVTGTTSTGILSATTYQNLPSQSGTGVSSISYVPSTGILTLTKNDATTLTAGTYTYLTGASYSNNTISLTNNLGSTSNVNFNTFTGATINGNLTVTGTTSSGILSATTYQNLPTDVRVTGGTYSSGTATFTNNTGGTFNVSGFLSNATTAVTLSSNVLSVTSSGGTPTNTTINAATGGTYSNGTITLSGTGSLSTITGLFTGGTDVRVTGATYSNNTFTFTNNTGGTFNVLFNTLTGATVNGNLTVTGTTSSGILSATTYQNLPTDVRVTGGTYSSGTATFTNNTGGTFNVTGFLSNATTAVTLSSNVLSVTSSGGTPTTTTINAATGGTYSNGTITLAGTGSLSTITGLFTGGTDVRVTGGTYSNGTATFTNNTGGTFNVTGFSTGVSFTGGTVTGATNFTGGLTANTISATTYSNLPTDVRVTGATYNNNTFTFTNNTGGTFNVLFNTFTGATINGNLSVTGTTSSGIISATTYQNLPTDIRVTGGTYSSGTATFTNNTGGTFNVTGFLSNATTAVTLSSNVLSVTSSGGTPTNTTINAATGGTYSNGTITLTGTGTLSTITGLTTPFTGGTVTGATNFTGGLTANTISATTYSNLPTDIRVTGATYSNNTFTYTNNTGGTFSVLFNTVTGLTINGNLSVTGTTSSGIISATTYQNLPTDIRVTGGTYSNGSATFRNNTGGTFNVTGFYTGQTSYVNSLTTGTGLSANTTTGNITILNTAPDQTVTILGGSGISVTGTYPNFTISSTGSTSSAITLGNVYTTANNFNFL